MKYTYIKIATKFAIVIYPIFLSASDVCASTKNLGANLDITAIQCEGISTIIKNGKDSETKKEKHGYYIDDAKKLLYLGNRLCVGKIEEFSHNRIVINHSTVIDTKPPTKWERRIELDRINGVFTESQIFTYLDYPSQYVFFLSELSCHKIANTPQF